MLVCLLLGFKDGSYGVVGPADEDGIKDLSVEAAGRPDVRLLTAVPYDVMEWWCNNQGEWYVEVPEEIEKAVEDFMWINRVRALSHAEMLEREDEAPDAD